MSSRSIANRLESARLALTNAMAETELRSALAPFGYDEARLQQGKGLYESALAVWQSQQQKQSRRRAAVAAYDRADAAASRRRSFASKVAQMRLFYSAALGSPEILSILAGYGFTESQLQTDFALVAALESARSQREVESGEVLGATRNRQQALSILDRWMGDFAAIAHLALEETPQRLEMLGLAG